MRKTSEFFFDDEGLRGQLHPRRPGKKKLANSTLPMPTLLVSDAIPSEPRDRRPISSCVWLKESIETRCRDT